VTATLTAADYQAAFEKEQAVVYPMVDAFAARMGYALERSKLEAAARVLACPVKKSPPNWQHGRVLYAAARQYLAAAKGHPINILDIGTAKGFSALCLQWALDDSDVDGTVTSVDVKDPAARIERNTIAEVNGLLTLAETLAPWPEAAAIRFVKNTGIAFLLAHPERIHVAFIDGSHDGETVRREGEYLAERQERGDLAIFDDVERADIRISVQSLREYRFDVLQVLPNRHYAIGVRR
jgi:predicted O-methyltransferase YrrM